MRGTDIQLRTHQVFHLWSRVQTSLSSLVDILRYVRMSMVLARGVKRPKLHIFGLKICQPWSFLDWWWSWWRTRRSGEARADVAWKLVPPVGEQAWGLLLLVWERFPSWWRGGHPSWLVFQSCTKVGYACDWIFCNFLFKWSCYRNKLTIPVWLRYRPLPFLVVLLWLCFRDPSKSFSFMPMG